MSTIYTFLLAVSACIGTVMLLADPLRNLEKKMRGKRKSEFRIEIRENLSKGFGYCLFILLSLLYTLMVHPIAVISALVNKIGNQPFAYVMLCIVAFAWVERVRTFMPKNNNTANSGTVLTSRGDKVEGVIVNLDEEIKLGNPNWNLIKRVFFALSTIYLWYLFLVVIGVLK